MSLTGLPLIVLLFALAAGSVGIAVVRTGWQRGMAIGLVAVLLPLGAGAVVNRHFDYLTSWRDLLGVHSRDLVAARSGQTLDQVVGGLAGTPAPRLIQASDAVWAASRSHGVLLHVRLDGPLSGISRAGFVYLPPQYFSPAYARTRFPVVELFHGSPGIPANWVNLRVDLAEDTELAERRAGPMILVMPDDNGSVFHSTECVNAAAGQQAETYLSRDVPAFVAAHFRTMGRWGADGYSTGGFCAVNLALRNPATYAAAVGVDANYWAIEDHYTGHLYADQAQREANSPIWEVMHGAGRHVAFYLLTGRHDESRVQTEWFGRLVGLRPPNVLVVQRRGQHSFADWRTALGRELDWLWARLASAQLRHDFPVNGLLAALGQGSWRPHQPPLSPSPVAVRPSYAAATPRPVVTGGTPGTSRTPSPEPTRTPTPSPSPTRTPTPSAP